QARVLDQVLRQGGVVGPGRAGKRRRDQEPERGDHHAESHVPPPSSRSGGLSGNSTGMSRGAGSCRWEEEEGGGRPPSRPPPCASLSRSGTPGGNVVVGRVGVDLEGPGDDDVAGAVGPDGVELVASSVLLLDLDVEGEAG